MNFIIHQCGNISFLLIRHNFIISFFLCAINTFCNLVLMHIYSFKLAFSLYKHFLFFVVCLFAASFSCYSLIILICVTLFYCKLKYIFYCLLCTLPAFLLLFFAFLLPSNLVESPFRDAICHTFHVKVTRCLGWAVHWSPDTTSHVKRPSCSPFFTFPSTNSPRFFLSSSTSLAPCPHGQLPVFPRLSRSVKQKLMP